MLAVPHTAIHVTGGLAWDESVVDDPPMLPGSLRTLVARLRLWAVATAAVAVLLPFPATAGKLEPQERAAKKACLTGDPATGAAILADLFMDTGDPTYIYNQGRCYEQNSRFEDAISRFREYLRKVTNISTADRAEVEKHIADCQALVGPKPATAPAPASAPVVALPPAAPPAPTAIPAQPAQVVAVPAAPAEPSGRGLRIAGIACGVLGLASIGTGVYYYTRAVSYSDKVAKQPVRNPSDVSAGQNAETMQWVFYSVGGAAVATGVVLYLVGRSAGEGAHSAAAIAPFAGPGVAGLSAQGSF